MKKMLTGSQRAEKYRRGLERNGMLAMAMGMSKFCRGEVNGITVEMEVSDPNAEGLIPIRVEGTIDGWGKGEDSQVYTRMGATFLLDPKTNEVEFDELTDLCA